MTRPALVLLAAALASCAARPFGPRHRGAFLDAHVLPHQRIDAHCPRFAYVPLAVGAGAGHIFSDIVLGVELADRVNATFVLDDLDDPGRPYGKHGNYPGLLQFLNIDATEAAIADIVAAYRPRVVNTTWDDAPSVNGCNVLISVQDTSCASDANAAASRLVQSGFEESCQTLLTGLYSKHKPTFMTKYHHVLPRHRRSFRRVYTRDAVNIAWHIRVGDVNLHQGDDEFFDNIWTTLDAAVRATNMPVANVVFSESAPPTRAQHGYSFLARLPNVTHVTGASVVETIFQLTQADVVVETGSSMTTIVHTIADGPLFVYTCPKEGCDVRFYDVDGLFKTDGRGRIDAPLANLISGLQYRLLSSWGVRFAV